MLAITVTTLVDENDGVGVGGISLRDAIAAAAPGETVDFAPDLVSESATMLLTYGELVIDKDLTITGPGANLLTIDAAGNDPTPEINDGTGSRVFRIEDLSADLRNVSIVGLTLTGGDSLYAGGAIRSLENLTLTDSVLTGNHAHLYGGGGLYAAQGQTTVAGSTVSNNSTLSGGGGIRAWGGKLTVVNSTVSGNTAQYQGGGIFGDYAEVTIDSTTMDSNSSQYSGGGAVAVRGYGTKLHVLSSTITGNKASIGGGIYANSGSTLIEASTLSGNTASVGGGGVYSFFGTLGITDSLLTSNISGTAGGGLSTAYSTTTITRATIVSNTAVSGGGGIDARGSFNVLNIVGSTISANSVTGLNGVGGGVNARYTSAWVTSSVITGNTAVGNGGGLAGRYVTIEGSAITSNTAGGQGGGVWNAMGSLSISNSSIRGNFALSGGGLYARDGGVNVRGTTISGNAAGSAGAMRTRNADVSIVNSTVSGNTANNAGGGLYLFSNGTNSLSIEHSTIVQNTGGTIGGGLLAVGGSLNLGHTILATNTAPFARDVATAFGTALARYSFIGDNSGSSFAATPANATDANGNRIGPSVSSESLNVSIEMAAMGDFEAGPGGDSFLFEYSVDGGPYQPLFASSVDESTNQFYFMDGGASVALDDPLLVNGVYLGKFFQTLTATIPNPGAQVRIRFTATNDGPSEAFAWRNLHLTRATSSQVVGAAVTFDGFGDLFTSYLADADYGVTGDMFGIRSRISQGLPSLPFDIVDDSWSIFTGDVQGIVSQFDTARFFGVVDTVNGVGNDTDIARWTFDLPPQPIDPLLGALADNGGLLLPDGSRIQTHAPLAGSAVVDAGDVAAQAGVGGVPTSDQRDIPLFSRVADGDGNGSSRIDIGAFEQQSVTFIVDTLADESDGDFSAGDLSLREAIELSNGNPLSDAIQFAPALAGGTILLTHGVLSISDTVAIHGLGDDQLTIDASGNDPTPFENLGDGSGIFSIGWLGASIDGLTLTGADSFQGAIYSLGNLIISNSTISGNSASFSDGGGVSIWSGNLTVNSSVISGNSSVHGGGISARYSVVAITDSVISGNAAAGGRGGGVYLRGGSMAITNSVISSNSSVGGGGGIAAMAPNQNVVVTGSVISGNTSSAGGGIYAYGANIAIQASVVHQNWATGGDGGGISSRFGILSIAGSTISANLAQRGGGVWLFGDTEATIANSTISGNQAATTGGNLYLFGSDYSPLTIHHSTITNGFAGFGGGIFAATGVVNLDHVIVAQNSATLGPDITGLIGLTLSARYSLVGSNANSGLVEAPVGTPDANGNLIGGPINGTINALLGGLGYYGGPDLPDGSKLWTHGLQSGSPALDAGDPSAVAGSGTVPEFDERGAPFSRVVAKDASSPMRIDIGAFETQPLTFIVDTLADEDDGNYLIGDLSLREAISLANINGGALDTVTFNAALTGGTIQLVMGQLTITDSIKIAGLGDDVLTVDASGNDPTPDVDDGFGSRVFFIESFSSSLLDVEISGLKLTGGDVSGNGGAILSNEALTVVDSTIVGNASTGSGGGIFQNINQVTITGVIVSNNISRFSGGGGGLFAVGTATITGSTISDNKANGSSGVGGGIRSGGNTTITDSTISGNTTTSGGGGSPAGGGGIYSSPSTPANSLTIINSTVTNNRAPAGEGGGIRKRSGTLIIQGSTISENSAFIAGGGISASDGGVSVQITASTIHGNAVGGPSFGGGGAFIFNGTMTVTGSTISGNSSRGGGGVYGRSSKITIADSTISGNAAANNGGGVFVNTTLSNPSHGLNILNSTVSGNTAVGRGGGVYNLSGLTTIQFSTVTNNSAGVNLGGGVGSHAVTTARTEIRSTIVAGNINGDVQFVTGSTNSFLSNGYNLIGTGNGTANFNKPGDQTGILNPFLGPLANNGGPTNTHALLVGGPAIDAGDPAAVAGVVGVPVFDQRSKTFGRVLDANYLGGPRIDIGAFELAAPSVLGDYNVNGVVDMGDYVVWRKLLGTTNLIADGSGNGTVDQDDYLVWRAHFGESAVSSSALGSGSSLPMPGASQLQVADSPGIQPIEVATTIILMTDSARRVTNDAVNSRATLTPPFSALSILPAPQPQTTTTRAKRTESKRRSELISIASRDDALEALLARDALSETRMASVAARSGSVFELSDSDESCATLDEAFAANDVGSKFFQVPL